MNRSDGPIAGIDGCRRGWVVVRQDVSGTISWEVSTSLARLFIGASSPSILAVDIPIGLPHTGSRTCDGEARRLLGSRRSSSVFPAPIRPLLDASSYSEACDVRFRAEGKRVSKQAWAIVPKVREADELVRADRDAHSRIREVHPEVSFYYMAGGQPMRVSKKKAAGQVERVGVLRPIFGDHVLDEALRSRPSLGCEADDLLDAFAALWTARRIREGTAIRLPSAPPVDPFGLPMEMVA